jgi:hypothetical protein
LTLIPLTLLVPQTAAAFLTAGNSLAQNITGLAATNRVTVPVILSSQVVVSAAAPQIGDMDMQLTYPRVSLYTVGLKNTRVEKFRTLSGSLTLVADIWASADLMTQVDQWIHYYVEGVTEIFRQNTGDWGNGIFFDGSFDIQFHLPATGGLGFVQNAKVTLNLHVSRN